MRRRLYDVGLLAHAIPLRMLRLVWWSAYAAFGLVLFARLGSGGPPSAVWAFLLHLFLGFFLFTGLDLELVIEPATRRGRRLRDELQRQLVAQEDEVGEDPAAAPSLAGPCLRRRLALFGCEDLWTAEPVLSLALALPDRPMRGD